MTQFTASQEKAINTGITADQKHNVLVSASAGSGKTTVLIERIMHEIDAGIDIDQLLVVTFTELAAKHMKDKLEQQLTNSVNALRDMSDRSAADDERLRRYRRQLGLIGVANISTLHAFCLQVIRRYYYVIDLDPGFRLLTDSTERLLLRDQVWESVLEDLYQHDGAAFERLVANFSGDRNDEGLTKLVKRLFDFAQATPNPQQWLGQLAAVYAIDNQAPFTSSTLFQKEVQPLINTELNGMMDQLAQAIKIATESGLEKTQSQLEVLVKATQQAQMSLKNASWNEIGQAVDAILASKPRFKKTFKDQPELEAAAALVHPLVEDVKKNIKKIQADFLSNDESTVKDTLLGSKTIIEELVRTVQKFGEAFAAEKRRKHVLDFNDLEHFTLSILTNESSASKDAKITLQGRFSEIMVDEYQDTNMLQETILRAVGTTERGNMFMVGDVKQSIYQFRLADPSLFLNKYADYGADAKNGERIILAENFRSVNNIDQFVNLIFTQLMDQPVGQMDYDQNAELQYGAQYYDAAGETLPQTTKLLVYETDESDSSDQDSESEQEDFDFGAKVEGPIAVVADKINELMQADNQIFDAKTQSMRQLQYSDIALLVPTRSNNLAITEVFKRAHIPIVVRDTQNYFRATEIRIMMALLSVIDNPYQDIPLVAVLRSPMVGLDENQLVYLRIYNRTSDYFQALKDFYEQYPNSTQQTEFGDVIYEKVATLMGWLTEFRDLARQNQLVTLIWRIYERTGFLDYVGGMPAGQQRQANLHALYERAHDYEQSSFKGLFQFVRFIERMQERDQDLAEATAETNTEAVQVMTIHGSKGLEFPVVFLMDATHKFNQRDTSGNAIIDRNFGLGITYIDPSQRISYDTLPKVVAANYLATKNRAEEMRKLYVALTRAEQQLYVVGAYQSKEAAIKKWRVALNSNETVLQASVRQHTENLMDWVGMTLIRVPAIAKELDVARDLQHSIVTTAQPKIEFYQAEDLQTSITSAVPTESTAAVKLIEGSDDSAAVDQLSQAAITKILNFQYPYQDATQTTAYQSVSEVKRLFEDPDNLEMGANPLASGKQDLIGNRFVTQQLASPAFLQSNDEQPSAAAIGTATHLILERLDLQAEIDQNAIEKLIQQLVADHVLDANVANQVPIMAIIAFFKSELGQQLVASPNLVQREVPFSLLLPANRLFDDFKETDHGQILIHGIIDGFLATQKGLILFDYKTDHVHQADELIKRYAGQVNLYALALAKMQQQPVVGQYLYSLTLNQLIPVPAKGMQN